MFQTGQYELHSVDVVLCMWNIQLVILTSQCRNKVLQKTTAMHTNKIAMPEEAACVDIQSEHAFFSATLYLPYVSLTNKPGK